MCRVAQKHGGQCLPNRRLNDLPLKTISRQCRLIVFLLYYFNLDQICFLTT